MRPDELEQRQLGRLRRSQAVATGMLAVAAAVFAASLSAPDPGTGILLLRAIAEAALVGGLADWFAVTALFRPLGLPIPHTAIVPANKDRIGEGLARFLDRNFLTRDLLLPNCARSTSPTASPHGCRSARTPLGSPPKSSRHCPNCCAPPKTAS